MGLRLSLKKKSKKSKGAAAEGKTTIKKVSSKKSKETITTRTTTTKEEEESKSNSEGITTIPSSSSSCGVMMIQDETITNPIAHEASIEVRSFGASDSSLTEITLEEESLQDNSEEVYATKELDDPNINMDSSQHRRRRDFSTHEEDSSIDLVAKPLIDEDEDQKHKDSEEWNQIKQPLEEVVLQAEIDGADLSVFVDTFLNDDAPYSIEKYQGDIVGDKDIEYSKWKSGTTNIQSRSINFVHPLKNKVGPSQAKTFRQQQLSTFGGGNNNCYYYYGLCLQNTTRVYGVPGADCFRGEDKWILEHDIAKGRIQMTVSYRLVFEKRCMVQKIIQKNYRKETKVWYENYAKFIKESLMKVETASRSQQQQQQPKLEEKNLLQQQVNHHHPMQQQMIQKVNSSSDDTAATIQSSCTGSFDSPTSSSSNSGAADAEDKDQKIASLTSQVDDLKAINESQAKRIDELEQQLRLSLQSQQFQSSSQPQAPLQQQHQEKTSTNKLFTGHYIKQLQQHQQQQDKKLFTGHYLKQLQSTLDEHGRAVQ